MTKDEALKLALEALERSVATCFDQYAHQQVMSQPDHFINKAITAIKEALAQPEQEPVAWEQFYPDIGKPQLVFAPVKMVAYNCTCGRTMNFESDHGVVAPQRTWVGLTQTQVKLLWEGVREEAIKSGDSLNWVFYTHINEALKDKNTRGQA